MDRFKKTVKVDQHTTVKVDQHTELQEKQLEVIFTLRNMQQLYKNILDMGRLDQVHHTFYLILHKFGIYAKWLSMINI